MSKVGNKNVMQATRGRRIKTPHATCDTLITGVTNSGLQIAITIVAPDNRKREIMAAPVASSRSTETPTVRLHVWRVLSMLVALIAIVCALVLIVTTAA
ncbi:hypothetical protein ACLQ3C_17265 [Gordonia sp. DT30]|uniref:hypothetical protein n=1 Tax=unclassified Gordonia (in: high G+C Gram-positive bacteria) TaxID=2657482 RepID=UPI003CF71B8B